MDFYKRVLPEGVLCFDVGANIGIYSEAMCQAGARVVAVEPNAQLIRELEARCAAFPDFNSVAVALGSSCRLEELLVRQFHGQSGFISDWPGASAVVRRVFVPVLTLSELVSRFGTPYYVKIDVEGFEKEVVAGLPGPVALLSYEYHSDMNRAREAQLVAQAYYQLGHFEANFICKGKNDFELTDWISAEELLSKFMVILERISAGSAYGDIWLRHGEVVDKVPSL